MISVEEALTRTLQATTIGAIETTDILKALGCVLAEDIRSDIDMPPFDKSSMDGYALRAGDCKDVPAILKVVGTIPAGAYPEFSVKQGEAAKIMTGAPIPAGADSVQMVEKTGIPADEGCVSILESVGLGKHIALRGEIMRAGNTVLATGTYLSPAVVGVLATVGKHAVKVYKRPQVAILVTGDELVEVAQKPAAGQIRNSNGYTLYHQVLATGAVPRMLGVVSDRMDDLRAKIKEGLASDILLISGGVSMGEFDFVEDVLAEYHVSIYYDKINIKPGKPTVCGKTERTLIFGLPGNPVSASTIFEIFVRPAIRKTMGFEKLHNLLVQATLAASFASKTARTSYQPATTTFHNGAFFVTPVPSKGSADVLAFARSNSFVIAPADQSEFNAGDQVEVMLRFDFWQQ
ncbi:MAG: molybdopterin molybdotransferase MoeA [Caldithrix sp.]|nr:MAG: molybdopterin molybdotransferase MoeA [Caldithrix sp.]